MSEIENSTQIEQAKSDVGMIVPADSESSGQLTISKEFRPTPHMIVWLDTALQLMTDNITEIAETCQIARATWYEWLKNDQFIDWYQTQWDKRLRGEAWKLDIIGFQRAKRDFKYWEAMQRRTGNLQEEKPDTAVINQVNFDPNKYLK